MNSSPPIHICICIRLEHIICLVWVMYSLDPWCTCRKDWSNDSLSEVVSVLIINRDVSENLLFLFLMEISYWITLSGIILIKRIVSICDWDYKTGFLLSNPAHLERIRVVLCFLIRMMMLMICYWNYAEAREEETWKNPKWGALPSHHQPQSVPSTGALHRLHCLGYGSLHQEVCRCFILAASTAEFG